MIYLHWVPSLALAREFRKRFRQKRPVLFTSGRWHFHQENAPVHNFIRVSNYLTEMGIKTVPHLPFSPDLAPCDFWLFSKFKENLRGSHFETIEEMKESATRVVNTFKLEDFQGTFQKLGEWYNKCIAARGEYFEVELEFNACLMKKYGHTKKVWKLTEGTSYIYTSFITLFS